MHGLNGLIGAKQGRGRLYDSPAQMWSRDDKGHEVFQLSVLDIKNAEYLMRKHQTEEDQINPQPDTKESDIQQLRKNKKLVKAAKQNEPFL